MLIILVVLCISNLAQAISIDKISIIKTEVITGNVTLPLLIFLPNGLFYNLSQSFSFPTVQRKMYDQPTHIAQTEEPWCRLHDAATLASTRQSVVHCEHQVTTQEPDFDLWN